ncbi:hypothetical protein F5H01DRAFT_334675 [Linnemannia elongata]|nr:hypothetical protein F5H01DRAFT_334675 [Linnemannia elongata]
MEVLLLPHLIVVLLLFRLGVNRLTKSRQSCSLPCIMTWTTCLVARFHQPIVIQQIQEAIYYPSRQAHLPVRH